MAKIVGYKKVFKKQYQATCNECGAIIVFDEDELKEELQYNEYAYTKGRCPNCGKNVCFDKNRVPATSDSFKSVCEQFCHHYKDGKCTYHGTDWRECLNS